MILNEDFNDLSAESGTDYGTDWRLVATKSVPDSDGFMTDYAWYSNGEKHIFMFGDMDLYEPDEDYADWVAETEQEASEWFENYRGFEDDDDLDEGLLNEKADILIKGVENLDEFFKICEEIGIKTLKDVQRLLDEYHIKGDTPLDTLRWYKKKLGPDFKIDESYIDYDPRFGWTDSDIALHKATNWQDRNYSELPVEDDYFDGEAVLYTNDGPRKANTRFIKYIRPNPIFPPYYAPKDDPFSDIPHVGRMYDGKKHGNYDVHGRYETQDVYDALSESAESSGAYIIVAIPKDGPKGRLFYKNGEWITDIDEADIFEDYDDALKIWFNIDKSKFKRVFIPSF